ncbi:hypothetical protein PVAP13_4NG166584 [Panicum virgatum]|uniref:Uncharacterized protein n=1 Tax=Panicum virgatum TaxID=38727 RepID=A0A8T0T716_PANVG|nr:hypothetical protein PVAP13_4NG166584 [Panicum virgatum]
MAASSGLILGYDFGVSGSFVHFDLRLSNILLAMIFVMAVIFREEVVLVVPCNPDKICLQSGQQHNLMISMLLEVPATQMNL